jgi:flagellin
VWETNFPLFMLAVGELGADRRTLEAQDQFIARLSDAAEEGLGSIVDADMARESARLTALQTQQQLSVQTLGIANARPNILRGLFE